MDTTRLTSQIQVLPLPLAQLLKRSLNAKSATDRHHNAYFFAEAALKLTAAARIGVWMAHAFDPSSPLVDTLKKLMRPSAGHQLELLREVDDVLGRLPDVTGLPMGAVLGKAAREPNQAPALKALVQAARKEGILPEGGQKYRGMIGFFTVLVSYRNRVIGHGAQRKNSFYDRFADLLLEAAMETVSHPVFLGELQLVVAEERERGKLAWLSLTGLGLLVMDREKAERLPPPEQVKELALVSRDARVRLDPLVVFSSEDEQDQTGFLNEVVFRGPGGAPASGACRVDYLDFTTGTVFRLDEACVAMGRFLAKLQGKSELDDGEWRQADPGMESVGESTDDEEIVTRASSGKVRGRLGWTVLGMVLFVGLAFGVGFWWWTGRRERHPSADSPRPTAQKTSEVDSLGRILVLPPACAPGASTLVDELKESSLSNLQGVLLIADQGMLDSPGKSTQSSEASVGRKSQVSLVVASRCAATKLKVRLVDVASDAVLVTEELDPAPGPEQMQSIVAIIQTERTLLLARRETRQDEAFRLFQEAMRQARTGVNPSNSRLIGELVRQAILADKSWVRPRLFLAEILLMEYDQSYDDGLLHEAQESLKPLVDQPGWHQAETWMHLALIHFWREEFAKSQEYFLKANMAEWTDIHKKAVMELLYSLLLVMEGDFEGGVNLMMNGVGRDFGIPLQNLASMWFMQGQVDKALLEVEKSVVIQDRQERLRERDPELRRGFPGVVGSHSLKGFILLQKGRAADALVSFEHEARRLDVRSSFYNPMVMVMVHYGRAAALRALRRDAEAGQALSQGDKALLELAKGAKNPNFVLFNTLSSVLPFLSDASIDSALELVRPDQTFASHAGLLRVSQLHRKGRSADAETELRALQARARPELREPLGKYAKMLCRFVDSGRPEASK